MAARKRKVLIMGDDMRIFLALARSCGRAGLEVHAVPSNVNAPALSSRFLAKLHLLPDYFAGTDAWLVALIDVVQREGIDLVIPCTDPFILMLDQHRRALEQFNLAVPHVAAMDRFFDKEQTHAMCERLGVPVEEMYRLNETVTAAELRGKLGLPLVLKPCRSYTLDRPGEWGRVFIAETEMDVLVALAEIKDKSRYVAERFFDGIGCGISVLADGGHIVQAFQHRRLREGNGGSSSYRISETIHDGMMQACEKIAADTALTGVCMFEFRINDATGMWVLLETNARFWGSMALPLALGIAFPVQLFELLVEGKRPAQVRYLKGVRSRNITLDAFNLMKLARRGRFAGIGDFCLQPWRWLTGAEVNDSFAWDDPKPAWREFKCIVWPSRGG